MHVTRAPSRPHGHIHRWQTLRVLAAFAGTILLSGFALGALAGFFLTAAARLLLDLINLAFQ